MGELAEDVPADSALIKQLFFSRLPPQVKATLVPMEEKSSVDVIASSADKVMDFTKEPITASIPQSQAKVSTLSAAAGNTNQEATYVAILNTIKRLTKEVRKLGVGWSHHPDVGTKVDCHPHTTAPTQTNQDCAFITVALARRHGDAKCPVRF